MQVADDRGNSTTDQPLRSHTQAGSAAGSKQTCVQDKINDTGRQLHPAKLLLQQLKNAVQQYLVHVIRYYDNICE